MTTTVATEPLPALEELAGLALFRSVKVDELMPILRECEVRRVPSGTALIDAERPNNRLYLVLSGEVGVHLETPDNPPIVTLGAGESVGELSLLDMRPSAAFVVTHAPTRVLVLREATVWRLVSASHVVALNLLRILATRLRTDDRLVDEHREQLRQTQRLAMLAQLTGSIAHDFNNLLALATMDLELIAGSANQPRILKLAQEASEVLRNGAELWQRLQAFARCRPVETRLVDVNELVASTGEILRRSLGKRIRLRTKLTPKSCWAKLDPAQLQSALLNLAFNARDAMPHGGVLTIATDIERVGASDLRPGLRVGTFVVVKVADTGCGMPPEVMERAFEPLFTSRTGGGGTGLGLSMVHGFARQSGGHVHLASEVARGTTVTLYLPAADRRVIEHPERLATRPDQATEGRSPRRARSRP